MNLLLLFAIAVFMALLAWRKVSILIWIAAWWLAIFSMLRFGFVAPIPSSVLIVYMGIVTLVLLVYAVSDRDRQQEFLGPLVRYRVDQQHWHVYGVIPDNSVDAFTPTLGFATQVVSVTVIIFFLFLGFIFWLTSLSDKRPWEPKGAVES